MMCAAYLAYHLPSRLHGKKRCRPPRYDVNFFTAGSLFKYEFVRCSSSWARSFTTPGVACCALLNAVYAVGRSITEGCCRFHVGRFCRMPSARSSLCPPSFSLSSPLLSRRHNVRALPSCACSLKSSLPTRRCYLVAAQPCE